MAHLTDLIKKPLITEKTSHQSEKTNRYGFVVATEASKTQIKEAVEKLYDVKVLNVKTSVLPGKMKRFGRLVKKTSKIKRAYVQLSEGQRIEFFKGV